jgi:hypothetical protein
MSRVRVLTQIERDMARDLQAAGFLVGRVQDLRPPYEGAADILARYVARPELPVWVAAQIGMIFWDFPAARGSAAASALLKAYDNHRNADTESRSRIADGIARTATRAELPQILALLADYSQVPGDDGRGYSPRFSLVESIPRLMGKKAVSFWRNLLDDPEEGLRVEAVVGLCRRKDFESLPRLRAVACAVEHKGSRQRVAAALRKLEQGQGQG